jgi:hypothetical protein
MRYPLFYRYFPGWATCVDIHEKIEDLEDYYLAEKAYEEFVASGEKSIPKEGFNYLPSKK